jgi:hypothetical protein
MDRRHWIVAALAALLAPAAFATPAQAAVTPLAKINFQPAASATPAGYTADTGAAYDAARGSGWVRQDSLPVRTYRSTSPATPATAPGPASIPGSTR